MRCDNNIKIYSPIIQEAYDQIPDIDWATDEITEGIAMRIDAIMKQKGISKNVNSNAKVYQIVIQKYTTFEAAKIQKAGYTL